MSVRRTDEQGRTWTLMDGSTWVLAEEPRAADIPRLPITADELALLRRVVDGAVAEERAHSMDIATSQRTGALRALGIVTRLQALADV